MKPLPKPINPSAVSTLLLVCPDISLANDLVLSVTKDALVDFLLNLEDCDTLPVDDSWYHNLVADRCYNADGDLRLVFNNPQEQSNFERDERSFIQSARYAVGNYLDAIVNDNMDSLYLVYDLHPKELSVVKTLDDHLILMLKGY